MTASHRTYAGLDLLRGLAALTVVIFHVRTSAFVPFSELPLSQQRSPPVFALFLSFGLGHAAVLTFFVLSGFLVAGHVMRKVQSGQFDVLKYGIDRATRIFVPLVPACLFTVVVNSLVLRHPVDPAQVACNMVGLNGVLCATLENNAPLWTLAYEIWFYVTGGAVGLFLCRRLPLQAMLSLCVCLLVFSVLDPRYLLYWLVAGLFVFVPRSRDVALGFFGLALLIAGAVLIEILSENQWFYIPSSISGSLPQAVFCIGVCFVVLFLTGETARGTLSRVAGVASGLSAFSYTLYLMHYPTNTVVSLLLPTAPSVSGWSLSLFGLRILICIGVSFMMYLMFERWTPVVRRKLYTLSSAAIEARRAHASAERDGIVTTT